ncbi:MAG TPA: DNA mismatch repair protein MutS, partial [Ktedonobacterales bacterium]|nr:DNA mismatch repair protein MutS [Ktedonobacterales bacterium]
MSSTQVKQQSSPVRLQYLGVKRQHPDALLFFRMGDFYELFDEDAETAARELELTLTRRDWGRGEKTPMAGVPHHAADGYIARLIAKGYRVAVCEQVSDPALSKGLVEREVIRVVTPGTVVDPAMLSAKRNNFLAAAVLGRDAVGLAYADVTTGEFACTQLGAADPEAALAQELARVQPAEVLVQADAPPAFAPNQRRSSPTGSDGSPSLRTEQGYPHRGQGYPHRGRAMAGEDSPAADGRGLPRPYTARGEQGQGDDEQFPSTSDGDDTPALADRLATALDSRISSMGDEDTLITAYDPRAFREDVARARLLDHFAVASLEAFGCDALPLAVRAAGAILAYLQETQRGALEHFTALETYSTAGFMALDAHTRRNLELFESGRGGSVKGSLLWVLDATRTPMGGRLLRRWIGEPLLDLDRLRARQEAIAATASDLTLRARLVPALARTGDLERLINRAVQRLATPRDLRALAAGLCAVESLHAALSDVPAGLAAIWARIAPLPELAALIERALVDEPPLTLADGGVIRPGYSAEIDEIAAAARNARTWVAELEAKERQRTGIANLKVGYNKVFGYYLDVTNSQLGRVPPDYIRKQTLTTGERFITPDLKEYEALILNAQEKTVKLEQELFAALRAEVATQWAEPVLRTARALAELDVALALGEVAARNGYCRPALDDGATIHIVAGRHPVVEA